MALTESGLAEISAGFWGGPGFFPTGGGAKGFFKAGADVGFSAAGSEIAMFMEKKMKQTQPPRRQMTVFLMLRKTEHRHHAESFLLDSMR